MLNQPAKRLTVTSAVALALCSTPSLAAGLWLYEFGQPTMGSANAGHTAVANDATTAALNPAGMTRLDRNQMMVSGMGLYLDSTFEADDSSITGSDGGNAGGFVPAGGFAYAHQLNDDLWLGIGAASYMGLGLEYDNDWVGRYHVTKAELITMGLTTSLGYRVNEQWSVGAGVSLVYSELDQRAAINNAAVPGQAGMADGEMKLIDDDIAVGFTLSSLYELSSITRFGFMYRSEIDLEYKDIVTLNDVGPVLNGLLVLTGLKGSKVDLDMTMPQGFMTSVYHQVTAETALLANIGWQEWSAFGKQQLTLNNADATTLVVDSEFENTWHYAVGLQHQLSADWLLSAGLAFDESPTNNQKRSPDMPLDRQVRVATGAQYQLSPDTSVGVAYQYLDLGDGKFDVTGGALTGSLSGQYDTNHIHFLGASFNTKF